MNFDEAGTLDLDIFHTVCLYFTTQFTCGISIFSNECIEYKLHMIYITIYLIIYIVNYALPKIKTTIMYLHMNQFKRFCVCCDIHTDVPVYTHTREV